METIEGLEAVIWLRRSVWGYATVNGFHILGIALLVGSIINVDLRLIGLWRADRWREAMADVLPVAQFGFGLAIVTGIMLFSVRASRYLENSAFLLKLALLAAALANIVMFHRLLKRDSRTPAMRVSAAVSLCLWLGILGSGRAIGFL